MKKILTFFIFLELFVLNVESTFNFNNTTFNGNAYFNSKSDNEKKSHESSSTEKKSGIIFNGDVKGHNNYFISKGDVNNYKEKSKTASESTSAEKRIWASLIPTTSKPMKETNFHSRSENEMPYIPNVISPASRNVDDEEFNRRLY